MKNRRYQLFLPLAAFFMLWSGSARAESPDDILVIVNNSAGVKSVPLAEVRDIFLGRRMSWSAGGRVVPINARGGSPVRDAFRSRVLEMNGAEEARHWQDSQVRSGKTAPQEMSNTLQTVFRLGSAVSYVFRSDFKEGVARVVLVIPAG